MSFRLKTILGIALIELMMLCILLYFGLGLLRDTSVREMIKRRQIIAEQFAQANQNAVLSTDLATLQSAAEQMVKSSDILYARVFDGHDRLLAEAGDPRSLALHDSAKQDSATQDIDQLSPDQPLTITRNIEIGGIHYGRVELGTSVANHRQLMQKALQNGLMLALSELALSALFSLLLGTYLTRQLESLQQASQKMAAGELGYQVEVQGKDELARTAEMFNRMSTQLALDRSQLETALNRAEESRKDLQRQEDLLDAINYMQSLFIGKVHPETLFSYARDILLLWFNAEHGFICELNNQASQPQFLPITPALSPPPQMDTDELLQCCLYQEQEQLLGLQQSSSGALSQGYYFLSIPIILASSVIGSFTLFFPRPVDPDHGNKLPAPLMKTLGQLMQASQAQRKLEQTQLQLSRQQILLSAVIDTSIDGIATLDRLGLFTSANKVTEYMFGLPRGSLIGTALLDCLEPSSRRTLQPLLLGDDIKLSSLLQLTAKRADGTPFPIELAITHMPDTGKDCYNLNIRDITELKTAESELRRAKDKADAANQAKSSFLATISHEIRTPLNGVLGMLELLKLSQLDSGQQDMVDTARDSAHTLLLLIDDVLDFTKIEANQLELVKTPTDIWPLLQRVLSRYAHTAEQKDLNFDLQIDPLLAPTLLLDPLRLRQILQNFLSNAIKFTATGAITLRVQVEKEATGWQNLIFDVIDTGIGIPPEQLQTLFQPFSQGDSATSRRYGGTGLGLAISRRLAELMGGEVAIDSELGHGTRVSLHLCVEVAERKAPPPLALLPSAAPNAEKRILLVEDNPTNLKLATKQLEKLGYRPDTAEDGAQAFEKWRRDHYHLVMTDCLMPNIGGFELARLIRSYEAEHPARPRSTIIACTANAAPEELQKTRDAGMNDYLIKPFALETLSAALEKWLQGAPPSVSPPAAGAQPEGPAPLDLLMLRTRCGESGKSESQLLGEFLKNTRRHTSYIRNAIISDNLPLIALTTRDIQTDATPIGAHNIAEAARHLEQAAEAEQKETIPRLVLQLEAACLEVEQWLTKRRAPHELSHG
ncbi:ATP-binding protein [Chromobacterium subtsugae]|uniref:ATP-binding protein n=1 Tax=Chromobacterium subtsugae TaxID=251747 RepID=UPI00069B7AE3|nr:ATP-binding protein [Chromobacterium subtsugae]